jgi:hypothetical protein
MDPIPSDEDINSDSADDSDYTEGKDLGDSVSESEEDANTLVETTSTPEADQEVQVKTIADLNKEEIQLVIGYESTKTTNKSLKTLVFPYPHQNVILYLGKVYTHTEFRRSGFSTKGLEFRDLSVVRLADGKNNRAVCLSYDDGSLRFLMASAKHEESILYRDAKRLGLTLDYPHLKKCSKERGPLLDTYAATKECIALFGPNQPGKVLLSDTVLEARAASNKTTTDPTRRVKPTQVSVKPTPVIKGHRTKTTARVRPTAAVVPATKQKTTLPEAPVLKKKPEKRDADVEKPSVPKSKKRTTPIEDDEEKIDIPVATKRHRTKSTSQTHSTNPSVPISFTVNFTSVAQLKTFVQQLPATMH